MNQRCAGEPGGFPEEWLGYTVLLVAVLYSLSLGAVCINTANGETWRGWEILLWGWLAALDLGTDRPVFAWFANPLLAVTVLLFFLQRFRWAVLVGIPCLLLALSSLQLQGISTNEGGVTSAVTGYGTGFYLWLGTCIIPVAASILFDRLARKARQRREEDDEFFGQGDMQ